MYWMNPGGDAIAEALEALGLERSDLEDIAEEHESVEGNLEQGVYPVWDQVLEKAWAIREDAVDHTEEGHLHFARTTERG